MENRLVLVIEDEEDMIWTVQKVMEKVRYKSLTARTGEEGIQKALDRSPSVILLDIGLPDMSGFEVCRVIKTRPETADIKVILVTGLARSEVLTRGAEVWADYYVPKPFFPDDLAVDLYFMFDRNFCFSSSDRELLRLARPIPRKEAKRILEPEPDIASTDVDPSAPKSNAPKSAVLEDIAVELSVESKQPNFRELDEGGALVEPRDPPPPDMEKLTERLARDIASYRQMLEIMSNRIGVLESRLNHLVKSHYHP